MYCRGTPPLSRPLIGRTSNFAGFLSCLTSLPSSLRLMGNSTLSSLSLSLSLSVPGHGELGGQSSKFLSTPGQACPVIPLGHTPRTTPSSHHVFPPVVILVILRILLCSICFGFLDLDAPSLSQRFSTGCSCPLPAFVAAKPFSRKHARLCQPNP